MPILHDVTMGTTTDHGQRIDRRVTAIVVGLAVCCALYTGFRVPNAWSATLQAVSLTDGLHRRFVVGTVLRPFALATDFDYRLFATFSYLVLTWLLAIIVGNALRTRLLEQRLLVIAWLLAPTGGFLFDVVGYFEQLLYLLLFVSIWLVRRERVIAATVLMTLTPGIHEIAILTVLPLYGLVLLRSVHWKHAVIATAIPALVNVILLALPPAGDEVVASLSATLAQANFTFRADALALFSRTLSENWRVFNVHDVAEYVRPIAYVLIAFVIGIWFTDRSSWRNGSDRLPSWSILVASCAAIAVPTLLVYGGGDSCRWRFLVISNFVLVLWLMFDSRGRMPLRIGTITLLVFAMLFVTRIDLWYFDQLAPRELGYRPIAEFFVQIADGSLFTMARE